MRVVFTCGGTAGHINPAVAVAKLIMSRRPSSEILFIGSAGGMEVELIKREGFKIETVNISNFKRSVTLSALKNNIRTIRHILSSVRQAKTILGGFKPEIVIGTGGYASFPAVYAASGMGIPTAIHESNAVPGLTTSMLSKRADIIMTGFDAVKENYRYKSKVRVTGTPVRDGFIYTNKMDAKKKLGIIEKPIVVSYWGSLGAREMNKMIAEFMRVEMDKSRFHHIHATGSFGWKWMPEYVKNAGVDLSLCPFIDMREYIYDMPTVMSAADIVICRGGAATLNEVLASATPAIVIPSPNVTGNQQEKNAREMEKKGAAVVISEKNCTGIKLYNEVCRLLNSKEELEKMSGQLRGMAVLDAGERIYEVICSLIK